MEFSGRLLFDVTKWERRRERYGSGLNRVSAEWQDALKELLGERLRTVYWSYWRRTLLESGTGEVVGRGQKEDLFFTPEQFHFGERPGFGSWLKKFSGRTGVVFYDAIPFEYPEHSLPKSIRRFPKLLRGLREFDSVVAISKASREAGLRAGRELGIDIPEMRVVELGYLKQRGPPRPAEAMKDTPLPRFILVGMLSLRKGQDLAVDAAVRLWEKGYAFELLLVGRSHPRLEAGLMERIRKISEIHPSLTYLGYLRDAEFELCIRDPSIWLSLSRAEGYGLPVLEGVGRGLPVICTEQPCLESEVLRKAVRTLPEPSVPHVECAMEECLNPEFRAEYQARSLRARDQLTDWTESARSLISNLLFDP